MLVLVATHDTQGSVRDDYSWTVDGELVTPVVVECSTPDCGCDRGFPGLASHRATTTAMVVDLPHLSEHDLREALSDHLERGGWFDLLAGEDDPESAIDDLIDEHVEAIVTICEQLPPGTVIERMGTYVRTRIVPFAA